MITILILYLHYFYFLNYCLICHHQFQDKTLPLIQSIQLYISTPYPQHNNTAIDHSVVLFPFPSFLNIYSAMSTNNEKFEIFVGNLTSDTDAEKLTTLFGQAGTVVHAEGLNGKHLTVSTYDPRNSQPDLPNRPRAFDSAFSVYVCNLTRETDSTRLEEIFSKYGKVESIEFVTDSNGRSRGYGFVTMSSKTEMDDAIAGLDLKLDMGSRKMHVAELPRNL